ncbi:DUF2207 family protein [Fusibacter tunisiensis]|uniref:DUF2207 family protein n=1 Tax=Fusibacter tunisiensis TaxID=1008308 RepID=UPI0019578A3B
MLGIQLPVYADTIEIEEMSIDIRVKDDNSYDIVETLNVRFYSDTNHGIFRQILTKTYFGKNVKVSNVKVTTHPYDSNWEYDYIQVKIGDPDRYAQAFEIYEIHYTYDIGDDLNPEMDEFYFNLVGPEWEMPIHKTTFSIQMPSDFEASDVNLTYGYYGSDTDANDVLTISGREISGTFNQTLTPGEALTIALPLPEGYYSNVVPQGQAIRDFGKSYYVTFPLLFALAIGIMFKWGKDKQIFPTVEFYPPEGLTPLEIGYIYDGKFDVYDVTAMLVYWADRGYLKIIEEEVETGMIFKKKETRIKFEKLANLPADAQNFERIYFNELFDEYGHDGIVEVESLKESFYTTIAKVITSAQASFKNRRVFSGKGYLATFLIALIGILIQFFTMLQAFNQLKEYGTSTAVLFSAIAAVVLSIMMLVSATLFKGLKTRLPKERIGVFISGVVSGGIALLVSGGAIVILGAPWLSWLGWALAAILLYMAPHGQKRTELGSKWIAHLEGLKAFIENAEKSRIEVLIEDNPNYFYNVLPYAMVLGVTDKWAKQFEDIALEKPDWYASNQPGTVFSAAYFASHMNQSTRDMGRTMSSAPASSSSGGSFGGGSAGGGSGGGGGGGW